MLGPMQRQSCLDSGLPCWLLTLEVLEAWKVLVVPAEKVLAVDLEEWVAVAALVVPAVVVVAAGVADLLSWLLPVLVQ